MQRLPEWTAIRTRNALLLADALADLPAVRVPLPPEHLTHAWYKFYAFVQPEALAAGWSRDRILSEISAWLSRPFWELQRDLPGEMLPGCWFGSVGRLPVARAWRDYLIFLVPTITPEQMAGYAEAVSAVVQRACR